MLSSAGWCLLVLFFFFVSRGIISQWGSSNRVNSSVLHLTNFGMRWTSWRLFAPWLYTSLPCTLSFTPFCYCSTFHVQDMYKRLTYKFFYPIKIYSIGFIVWLCVSLPLHVFLLFVLSLFLIFFLSYGSLQNSVHIRTQQNLYTLGDEFLWFSFCCWCLIWCCFCDWKFFSFFSFQFFYNPIISPFFYIYTVFSLLYRFWRLVVYRYSFFLLIKPSFFAWFVEISQVVDFFFCN